VREHARRGGGLENIRAKADRSHELQDLSFARLLYEYGRTASLNEKEQAEAALRDGKAIVERLSAATPSTKKSDRHRQKYRR